MNNSSDEINYSDKLIEELQLKPLAGESGYISCIATSNIEVAQNKLLLKANNSIYYLLNRKKPINYLHYLESDDTHILISGGPVHYYEFFHEDNKCFVEHHIVGKDILKGERPVLMIPGGRWKALVLPDDVECALLATVVTPQWTEDRVKIGIGQNFIEDYKNKKDWATTDFLLKLIGPNFK